MKTLEEIEPRTLIDSLPYDIGVSGSYYLKRSLVAQADTNGISILASDVTLDLNGFTLVGRTDANDGLRIGLCSNITVLNGNITGWGGYGIFGQDSERVRVTDLNIITNLTYGMRLGPQSIVTRCVASENGDTGIYVDKGSAVSCSTAERNGGYGIRIQHNSMARACVANYNKQSGIYVYWDSVVVDCVANNNEGRGVDADGSIVRNCVANHNGYQGIQLYNDSLASGNVCDGNAHAGIRFGSDSRVDGNNCTDNAIGFFSTSSGLLIRNSASGNDTNYFLDGTGQSYGTVISAWGEITNINPWANMEF